MKRRQACWTLANLSLLLLRCLEEKHCDLLSSLC